MQFTRILAILALVTAGYILAAGHDEPPKVLQVKKTVGQIEESGTAITLYTRQFGLDTPEGVNENYSRFRLYDRDVVSQADHSQVPKRAQEFTKSKGYRAMYGQEITLTGECFIITGPSHATLKVEEKTQRVANKERLQMLLDLAESNYTAFAEKMLVGEFMDWSDNPAHIYIIPGVKMWMRLRSPESADYIASSYFTQDPARDFIILDDPCCSDYTPQVLSYAIAEQMLKEYGRIMSGKPDASFPLFFNVGVAAALSKLEACIPPPNFVPFQVSEVVIGQKARKIKRPNLGKLLPLKAKRLIPFADLKETKDLPELPEMKYTFLRESRAVIEKLWQESPLGMLSLIRSMSQGRSFDKEFCLSYCDMQRGILGTAIKEKNPNDTNIVVVGEAELKSLEKASNRLFYEMTQEKMTEDMIKAKKAKEAAKKEGAEAKAEGGSAEAPKPSEAKDASKPAEAPKASETKESPKA